MKDYFKFFLGYMKNHLKGIIGFTGMILIFGIVFALYKLPLGAVYYPALCTLVLFVLLVHFDVKKRYELHKKLEDMKKYNAEIISEMPCIGYDAIEKDYIDIIQNLVHENVEIADEARRQYNDMNDYYTMWVHQIKTPIASMKLRTGMEDSTFSREIASDLRRIEEYVEMVLTYIRLGSEKTDYVFKEVELDTVVRGSVRKFSGDFIRKKLVLDYDIERCTVLTDEKWLTFVIEQILSNAIKYTSEGSISVTGTEGGILTISDTGMGIEPEDLPRVFDRGYTGLNGRSEKKATGIGLYLCKRICDNLGYSISVQSEVGKGTEVIIDLKKEMLETE